MADDVREKLAAALFRGGADNYDVALDLLLPVVDEIAGKRAAETVLVLRAAVGVLLRRREVLSEGDLWWSLGELHRTLDASPDPAPVAHNHTRFRNDAGPWSPCPVSCPAAGLLR